MLIRSNGRNNGPGASSQLSIQPSTHLVKGAVFSGLSLDIGTL